MDKLDLCQKLPPEVIVLILSNLSFPDLYAFSSVCLQALSIFKIVPSIISSRKVYNLKLIPGTYVRVTGLDKLSTGEILIIDHTSHTISLVNNCCTSSKTLINNSVTSYNDGPFEYTRVLFPVCCVIDSDDNAIFSDRSHHTIRKLDMKESITSTIVGKPYLRGPLEDGCLNLPSGICKADNGNILICDEYNAAIRILTPEGHLKNVVELKGRQFVQKTPSMRPPYPRRIAYNSQTGDMYFVVRSNIVHFKNGKETLVHQHTDKIFGLVVDDKSGDVFFGSEAKAESSTSGLFRIYTKMDGYPVVSVKLNDSCITQITGLGYSNGTLLIGSHSKACMVEL
mmetsp:Transcript_27274/g.30368  ORF Transcript_27274/g.30368 Transcript_27274/m.30368 type:complete len:340 (+) Transcript_27274:48-1067(+)